MSEDLGSISSIGKYFSWTKKKKKMGKQIKIKKQASTMDACDKLNGSGVRSDRLGY